MKIKKHFITFWRTFFHVRVLVFIILGASIILLTFFTNSNALEIAISGVASVFIGIGVNNFSMLETHEKDRRKLKTKMLYFVRSLEFIQARISRLEAEAATSPIDKLQRDLSALQQLIAFTNHLMNEDDLLS